MALFYVKRFLIAIFLLSFLIYAPPSVGQAGIGIGLSSMYVIMNGKLGESMTTTVGVINPSPYDLKARVYFDCTNCRRDIYFFGHKIGEVIEDPYQLISLDKQEVYVPANTMGGGVPVTITLTPKLILIKQFRFGLPEAISFFVRLLNKNFDGTISIPYPSLVIGEHKLEGKVSADMIWSSFGNLGVRPAVGATAEFSYKGMPLSSFILLLVGLAIVFYVGIRKFKKKGRYRMKVLKFLSSKRRSLKRKKTKR